MISVQEAYDIILSTRIDLSIIDIDIIDSEGYVLAETIVADRDLPPYNRVAMDGIAIDSSTFTKRRAYLIAGVAPAGTPPFTLTNQQQCVEVMTGAPLPHNTDTVIRYEDVGITNGEAVSTLDTVEPGAHVHRQGSDAKQGDVLLKPGQRISSAEIFLFAAVGKQKVKVFQLPRAAVLSSGDELVDISATPAPHQIRKSNTYVLQAAMKQLHWQSDSFHLPDDASQIATMLSHILEKYDVLILSGGVSKGKFDFIPEALQNLGIKRLFHTVSQRPGKPMWYGTSADKRNVVFALPGNPVSTFLCFNKYIKPWALNCCNVKLSAPTAMLASEISFEPPLTYFVQVQIVNSDGKMVAHPQKGGGSGDFANLKDVDGFLELPAGKSLFKAGECYPYISFRV